MLMLFAAVVSLMYVSPENSALISPSLEIIAQTYVLSLLLPSSSPLTLMLPIANISTPWPGLVSGSKTCGSLASSPLKIGLTPVCLNVNALEFSPIVPLAIIEMPVPSTFAIVPVVSVDLLTMLYLPLALVFVPPFVRFAEPSASKITRPSALIWLICISLSKLAILIKDVFLPLITLFETNVLVAVILPSIDVLMDLVISLASVPTPVQTPLIQGPTSSPILPFKTLIDKLALFVVEIKFLATPLLSKSPSVAVILTLVFD